MHTKTSAGKYLLLLSWVFPPLLCLVHAQSQDLSLDTVPVDLGVPAGVSTILQDRIGFIWIGTYSGLYKYDGYSCVSYGHDPYDSTSIVDNRVSALYEDKAGVLWVGTWVGLEKFDRMNGTFRHFTPNPLEIESHEGNFVYSIYEDRNGNLWVGGLHGLYRFDRGTEKFTSVLHDGDPTDDITHSAVLAIYEDHEGGLWFGTRAGLQKYDFTSGKFKHCLNELEYEVLSIHEDNTGTLWLATSAGLKAYNPGEGTCATYRLTSEDRGNVFESVNHVRSICPGVTPGVLWLETNQGLFTFDTHSKTFVRWETKAGSFCLERSGTLLLAAGTGVKKLVLVKPPFREYPMGMNGAIAEVVGREGILWVFGSGWHKFDMKAGRFVPYSFGGDQVYFVHSQMQGGHMAFLKKDGSYCIRDSVGKQTFQLGPRWEKLYRSLFFGCRTSKGYYVGTNQGGLYLFDPRTNGVSELFNLKQAISWIHEDQHGSLWVATIMGRLVRYDQAQGTFTEFVSEKNNPSSWCGNPVNWLHEDGKGRVWIATSYGMDKYDPATGSFAHFTEKNGLLGNNVRGVAQDDLGCLWVSTTRGISKLNPETGTFKNYDPSYGFTPPADLLWGGVAKGGDGEMYVGGARGLIRFHPDSLHDNLFVPPIVITSFRIFDRPTPPSSSIRLPFDENFVSFEFAALSYISPERNQYAYKMEGLDRDWVNSGTRRYASYANLDPGEYVFRVKGSNNEGVWNEVGASIAITITPPWWKTRWAYAGYAAMIFVGLLLARRIIVARERLKHRLAIEHLEAEKMHEVDRLKSRFFSNISHEFRTPLTLILGPVEQALSRSLDKPLQETLVLVKRNAQKLHGMINELLEFSRIEAGNVRLAVNEHDLVPFLQRLVQSFQSWAERKSITLSIRCDNVSVGGWYDAEKLEKILNNLISNALKFTPDEGRVVVTGETSDGTLRITVEDTGAGIAAEHLPRIFDRFYRVDESHRTEGTGIGLALTKELVDLHHGAISARSEAGRGTTFTVSIPIDRKAYKSEEIATPPLASDKEGPQVPLDLNVSERAPVQPEKGELGEKPIVLVVEDNADVRTYMKDLLVASYHVLEAEDGEAGIEKAQETVPDLIISDVMMPKKDGYEVCRTLKLNEKTSHIPIILLTAKAASESKIEGLETGADDYLIKPFEPKELMARVKNLIELRRRLRERFSVSVPLRPGEIAITSMDDAFLKRLMAVVEERMSDETFSVEELGTLLNMSRVQLHRKITALTNQSAGEFIRYMRLHRAMDLLKGNAGTVSEIAYTVGFGDPSHFSRRFHEQFGVAPSEVRKNPEQQSTSPKPAQPS